MISGEMEPKSPVWLNQGYDTLRQLGYTPVADSDNPGDQYAQQTEAVGLEYLRLFLTEPGQAVESMGDYLNRFGDINRSAGILSRTTSEQFGMIVNIASLHYTTFGRDKLLVLHRQVDSYLSNRNSASIPGLTAQLRKPELIRDLIAHWSALHWPSSGSYARFLDGNTDWEGVQKHVELPENNPVMFALTIPLASTNFWVRQHFRDTYPELAHQGVDIIAAHIFNRGAHDELLRTSAAPDFAEWYRAHYKEWEDSMHDQLSHYGADYQPDILEAITEAKWNVLPEEEDLYLPSLTKKIAHTSFSLNEDGRLVRRDH